MSVTKEILDKIDELRLQYPNATSISYGKKIKDGVDTGEFAIRVSVKEKKPLSELDESEVVASQVTVDNQFIKTDITNENNLLKNAPHTAKMIIDKWHHPYSIKDAIFPLPFVMENKFWPSVRRVDDAFGDRNLVCTCSPIESYIEN